MRALLAEFLARVPGMRVVAESGDAAQARLDATRTQANVVIADVELCVPRHGADAEPLLPALAPYRVLCLAGSGARDEVIQALRLGAWGVLYHTAHPARLVRQVRAAAAGAAWEDLEHVAHLLARPTRASQQRSLPAPIGLALSARERAIIIEVAAGASNAAIAQAMALRPQTVKNRLSAIFDKLGVSTRVELALYALHHQLLDPSPPGPPA